MREREFKFNNQATMSLIFFFAKNQKKTTRYNKFGIFRTVLISNIKFLMIWRYYTHATEFV